MISQRVGDGTYLNAGAPSILIEPMEFLILLDGISFHDVMEARLIIEPELPPKMSRNGTPCTSVWNGVRRIQPDSSSKTPSSIRHCFGYPGIVFAT